MDTGAARCGDRGFTLLELLIVIVVLGVLAAVTVLAVRGITDQGEENACAAEYRNLVTAQEAHLALSGSYVDEATLLSSGTITSESVMFDVAVVGDSYQIASTGDCVAPSAGPPAPPAPPVPVVMPTSSFGWHAGVTAWRFGADTAGNDEIVVLGREQGKADWVAATGAGATSSRRVHFIDLDSLTAANLASLLSAVNTNGVTALGVYRADDDTPLPGSAAADVYSHLVATVGAYAGVTLSSMDTGANDLQALFAAAT